MLRDLLVRVSAGLLGVAIAVSCTREGDKPREDVGVLEQAATLAGAGGADLGAAGAVAELGGAPTVGVGGAGGEPETCDPATCEGPNSCTRCVGNQCVRYAAVDNHTCRAAAATGCDVADVCDGTSDSCPDVVQPSTTKCRDADGLCDVDDFCNGTTSACADNKREDGFQCRAALATGCDVADVCDGSTNDCPDVVLPSTTKCRDADGLCDVDDFCNGTTSACADSKRPTTFTCRAALTTGCDVADVCDGTTNACPDVVRSNATKCRDAAGACDADDYCDGSTSACVDGKRSNTFVCRAAVATGCDIADVCDGATNACPDVVAPSNTRCRLALGECDAEDFCNGTTTVCADVKRPLNDVCRPDDGLGCDLPDVCDGATNTCKPLLKGSGTACRPSAGDCDVADTCNGTSSVCADVKRGNGFVCRAKSGDCDVQDVCDGNNAQCPTDAVLAVGTECRAKGRECDVAEQCDGSPACPADGFQPNGSSCGDAANKCLTSTTCTGGECGGGSPKVCDQTDQCKTNACVPATGNCAMTNKANNSPCDDNIACTETDRCTAGSCAGLPNNNLCAKTQHRCGTYTCDPASDAGLFPDYCRMTPKPTSQQCRPAEGFCGIAEFCDGTTEDCPADLNKDTTVVCQQASCVGATAKAEITCNGAPLCPVQPDVTCVEYACSATTKTCGTECTNDEGCQKDHYCVDNKCEKRIDPGGTCTDDSQCSQSNPYCVDGVCCNSTCTGQCEACDVQGQKGNCSIVTGPPHGKRSPCRGDGSSCTGTCGGQLKNNCFFPPPSTECVEAACDPKTSTAIEQAFCDGAGNCAQLDPMDCTPYSCGATACRGNCVSDAQCAKDAFCKAGICEELQKPGQKCARDGQCASGFCTDGVCCEGRCDGQCEACAKTGKCEAVTGAPVGTRPTCAGGAGDECAGACNGTLRATCSYPAGEVRCRDAGCEAGKATVVAHCTGAGSCAPEQTVACPNGCEGAICAGDACLINSDCKKGEHCLAGTCAPRGEDGAACGSASDCDSGFCVDGVCCNRACDGQCEACDNAKQPGTCSAVSGAPHGSRVQCTSDGSACGGACDGKNGEGCSYPAGTACGAGSCAPGEDGAEAVATVEAQCNGSGRCPAPRQQACGGAGCDAEQKLCNGECADGSACRKGQYCSAGVCVDSQPTGTACQAAADCASGFCVDGYCCGSACDDRCAACDVPGSLGTCTPVSGNTPGGRAGCRGGGVCGSLCDGKNVIDCAFTSAGTACADGYCSSGTQVGDSSCDGAGQCQPGAQVACSSFSCDGAECSDACETDSDCTRSMQCREGTCTEPYKIDAVDEGTCGCRAPGSQRSANGAAILALGAVALLSWRRRRGSRAA